ncbi:FAD-dependent oxidoreductase [Aquirhabdus sp.]|uniref:FAD-dependent oxidoreductase n=1 Tax=Aquirhabdus sp. TaxID=2824160 RepID=UPI00396CF95C
MNRRHFLGYAAASSLMAGCRWPSWSVIPPWLPIKILDGGMRQGHQYVRDQAQHMPSPSSERHVDTVILGGGIAGLTAGWRLAQAGFKDFLLLNGFEQYGNASAGEWQDVSYPRGAHYLPFPTPESVHVQEILRDFGILQGQNLGDINSYDERCVVHSPDERLWLGGGQYWHDTLMPPAAKDSADWVQQQRFLKLVNGLKGKRGLDGKVLFAIPIALSSQDAEWRKLDTLTFDQWLDREGYTSEGLRWYLDYSCRDDYGFGSDKVSAWAGIHYFASRIHDSEKDHQTSLLTWGGGLNPLAQQLSQASLPQQLAQAAMHLIETRDGVQVWSTDMTGKVTLIKAKRAICAIPLHVLKHVFPQLKDYGFDVTQDILPHVPWLVSNVWLNGFPREVGDVPLSWENIVYGSKSLGYVVATQQWIRVARPSHSVFTAYHSMADQEPDVARAWMQRATPYELLDVGLQDLIKVYGPDLWPCVAGVEVMLRGHAMSAPVKGYLSQKGLLALRDADQKVMFAHSDLSGYSIFEEASWWGWQAAGKLI